MLSRFFVNRPIFAWVIAITIMLAGVLAIFNLPVSQYPNIAPPQVRNLPGRFGRDHVTHRHAGDRAEHDGFGRFDLHELKLRLDGPYDDYAHLRGRHQS